MVSQSAWQPSLWDCLPCGGCSRNSGTLHRTPPTKPNRGTQRQLGARSVWPGYPEKRRVSYFADMVTCPVLALGLSSLAFARFSKTAIVEWALIVIVGFALWTLVEYAMHRLI